MVFVDAILEEGFKGTLKLNINEIGRYLGKILPPPASVVVRYSSEIKKYLVADELFHFFKNYESSIDCDVACLLRT